MSFVNICRLPTHMGRRDRPGFYRDAVTPRPHSGSAYGHNNRANLKYEPIWSRKLWLRIIFAYTFIALLGIIFIILGSIYVKDAYFYNGTSLPLLVCILAIVSGLIMLFGSFVLGKLFIRKKRKRHHRCRRSSSTHGNRGAHSSEEPSSEYPAEPPPPYIAYGDPSSYTQPGYNETVQEVTEPPSEVTGSVIGVIPPPEYCIEPPTYVNKPPSYNESTAQVHSAS